VLAPTLFVNTAIEMFNFICSPLSIFYESIKNVVMPTPTKLVHIPQALLAFLRKKNIQNCIVFKLKLLDFVLPLRVSGLDLLACLQRSIPKLPSAAAKLISFKLCFEMGPACCIKFH
jgi:hypothetical protein